MHQTGHIIGFKTGDTISLAGDWALGSLTHPTGATTALNLSSGSETHSLFFNGHYTRSEFDIALAGSNTTIKFA